ncbi:hypothetical protein HYPGJ_10518 [Hyphomicrobium sp. GJ21]|nr:hypothetical protein HYPGJ_10518 [Hyphomicrobium sp. GJ21]
MRLCAPALIAPRLTHNLPKRVFAAFPGGEGRVSAHEFARKQGYQPPKANAWRPEVVAPGKILNRALAGLWGTAAGASAS